MYRWSQCRSLTNDAEDVSTSVISDGEVISVPVASVSVCLLSQWSVTLSLSIYTECHCRCQLVFITVAPPISKQGHLANKTTWGAIHRFCYEWVSIIRVLLNSRREHYCLQPIAQFNLFCTSICSESTTVKLLLVDTSRFHRVFFAGSELPECKQFRILDCEHFYLVPF